MYSSNTVLWLERGARVGMEKPADTLSTAL